MDDLISCIYSDGKNSEALRAVEKNSSMHIKQFIINEFIVKEAGFYEYAGKIWHLDKEGFYQFASGDDNLRQYLFNEDIELLMSSLDQCCQYSGEYQPKEHYEIQGFGLRKKNEENLPQFLFTVCMLRSIAIPHRHISLYSPTVGNSIFDWVEVWDKAQNSWTLYWLEKNLYLGKTDKDRNCFAVFDEVMEGRLDFAAFSAPKKRLNDILLSQEDVLKTINDAIFDSSKIKPLLEDLKVFPIIRSDGYQMLKVYSHIKYQNKMIENSGQVYIDGTENLASQLLFIDDDYLTNDIYAPQLYIMKGKYANIT